MTKIYGIEIIPEEVSVVPVTTSRSNEVTRSNDTYKITAYCACVQCCGKTDGITASGAKVQPNHTIAAPSRFAFGTQIKIGDIIYTVEDRGGAITGNRIDIYFETHQEALNWGVRYMEIEVL